jgi:DnaK suppressor protein
MSRKEAILNLHEVLIMRRDSLRRALAGDLGSLKELRAQPSDEPVDPNSLEKEISSQLAEVESRELARTEVALERMSEGQYGVCEVCLTNIPMARLLALPYATRCIRCQREFEHQESLSATRVDWDQLLDPPSSNSDLSIEEIEFDGL